MKIEPKGLGFLRSAHRHEIIKEENTHMLCFTLYKTEYTESQAWSPHQDQNSTTPTITFTNGGLSSPNMNPMPRQLSPPHEHSLPWNTSNNSLGRLKPFTGQRRNVKCYSWMRLVNRVQ